MEKIVDDAQQYAGQTWQQVQEIFREHPQSVNQTYLEHLRDGLDYGLTSCLSGGALIVHSFFPFLFQSTGSTMVKELNDRMQRKLNPEYEAQ